MSTRYNYTGGLTTEGLVLNLDAAKRDSYPGSGTLWRDLSGNGNNGTLTNGPTYTGVSKDAAIVFDGVNDFVQFNTLTSPPNLQPGDTITIESWVKKTSTSGWQPVVTKIDSSNWLLRNYELVFAGSSLNAPLNSLSFFYRNSANSVWNGYSTTTTFTDNQWYHISYTYKMSTASSAKMYVNGAMTEGLWRDGTGNDTPSTTSNVLRIGTTDPSFGDWYGGNISSTKIYNRALSQFDVWQNFNSYKSRYGIPDIVTDGLVLNLDAGNPYSYLQGSSGTTWTDVSGQGNNGTLINGASYSNGTIIFDGVDDYARVPYSVSLNPETITVNAWINRTQAINYAHFIGLPVKNFTWSPPYMSYGVEYIGTSNTISFVLGFTNNTFAYTDFNLSFGNNRWFNFTASYDRSSVKIYIDGVLVVTRAETRSMFQSTADFYVGAINSSAQYPLNGKIGVTQVYNRSLSANEIQQNFQSLRGRYGI